MHVFISLASAPLLGACSSVYTRTADELPVDAHTRLDLRVREARETVAAADRLLAAGTPSLDNETWEESLDECRRELDRRVESVRDAAARVPGSSPTFDGVIASLDAARASLHAIARGPVSPDDPGPARARTDLADAVAAADRIDQPAPSDGTLARLSAGGGAGPAAPPR